MCTFVTRFFEELMFWEKKHKNKAPGSQGKGYMIMKMSI